MGHRWLVVVNRAAGPRPVDIDRVRSALARAGVAADVRVPPDKEAMRGLISTAGVDRLAVVGGDGTVNLAVNALVEAEPTRLPLLGVLPAGGGCDLLRTFGIPQELEGAARHLAGDATYAIDIGEISGAFGRRRFVNVGQSGVGAAAVHTAGRLPRRLGSARYPLAFSLRLGPFPSAEIELTTDRRAHRGRALAVIFANAQFFAGGWRVAPKAMLVDGLFDLQVIDAPKTQAPVLVPKIIRGLHLGERSVRRLVATRFRLEVDRPWPVEVDGDLVGRTPVEGRVLPGLMELKI